MKLKLLLKSLPAIQHYSGKKDVDVLGLSSHSKSVAPGFLFIAKKGLTEEGSRYLEEAVANGAVAVLTAEANPFLKETTQLVHPEPESLEPLIASLFYGNPSHELTTIGITGTSGKTTISYLLKFLLDAFGYPSGLIGTIEYCVGNARYPATHTTPDVITNQKLLREMRRQNCQAAIMEVSSHGLHQKRVAGISFDYAIFTNLSHDHLDYHRTMEEYAASKAILFESLSANNMAIVNIDDSWSSRMLAKCKARLATYGFTSNADFYAHSISLRPEETTFKVTYQGETVDFSWSLIGRHNVSNVLPVLAVLVDLGIPLAEIVPALKLVPSVPGRLERVGKSLVFVDYAHKPDALEKVLLSLKEISSGRLITLFGCGGDRDKAKRSIMAQVAERYSDLTVITSDNPRSEDPNFIIQEIIQGFKSDRYMIEPNRRSAIEKVIKLAGPKDLILIAGKGHETYQIFAYEVLPFDDREVAKEFLDKKDA